MSDDDKSGRPAAEPGTVAEMSHPQLLTMAVTRLVRAFDPKPDREGLHETPARFIKAMRFWCSGHEVERPEDILKTFSDGADGYDELVFVGSIPFYSTCEHHLATFFGVAHVGYIPNGRVVGLSKIPRLVECFARRLTVQERITTQVADTIAAKLEAKGVGVVLQARHMCMESRGVQKPGSVTSTSALRGLMKTSDSARAEFLQMVALAKGVGLG